MMARAARPRQASSVARQIYSPKRTNNLQARGEIFEQSVALPRLHTQRLGNRVQKSRIWVVLAEVAIGISGSLAGTEPGQVSSAHG
ncbi:MAG: hypothetical protein DMG62_20325 [Acidobacteria bacterium]|nr:MAG: hypothetical protein DMG62_20325 [Acidobacteriota bacterium]